MQIRRTAFFIIYRIGIFAAFGLGVLTPFISLVYWVFHGIKFCFAREHRILAINYNDPASLSAGLVARCGSTPGG